MPLVACCLIFLLMFFFPCVLTGRVLLCVLLCICSTLSRLPHYRVSVRVMMTHLHSVKSLWHFSHVFQTALTLEDRWGICSIKSHGHWARRSSPKLMSIKRVFVKPVMNKGLKRTGSSNSAKMSSGQGENKAEISPTLVQRWI